MILKKWTELHVGKEVCKICQYDILKIMWHDLLDKNVPL